MSKVRITVEMLNPSELPEGSEPVKVVECDGALIGAYNYADNLMQNGLAGDIDPAWIAATILSLPIKEEVVGLIMVEVMKAVEAEEAAAGEDDKEDEEPFAPGIPAENVLPFPGNLLKADQSASDQI